MWWQATHGRIARRGAAEDRPPEVRAQGWTRLCRTVFCMMRESPGSAAFVLTAAGLLAYWCGSILPSTFIAQPVYGVFMSWEVDAPPQDWREARERYFRVNVVRGLGSAVAFVCFVIAAMIEPL